MKSEKILYKDVGRKEVADRLRSAGYISHAEKYERCGKDSIFLKCMDCGHLHSYPISCGLRICEKCGGTFSKLIGRYKSLINSINHPKLLTLTVKNLDSLSVSDIDMIRADFHEFREIYNNLDQSGHRDLIDRSSIQEKKKNFHRSCIAKYADLDIYGGLYTIEINKKKDSWNLHIHALVDSFFISQLVVSEIWQDITISNSSIVDVRSVSAYKGMLYCLKYLNKTPEIRYVSDMIHFHGITRNKRLLGTFGSLYSINMDEIEGSCEICGSKNLEFFGSTQMDYSFFDHGRTGPYIMKTDPYQTVFI